MNAFENFEHSNFSIGQGLERGIDRKTLAWRLGFGWQALLLELLHIIHRLSVVYSVDYLSYHGSIILPYLIQHRIQLKQCLPASLLMLMRPSSHRPT